MKNQINPLTLMHKTPCGNWAVDAGKQEEFDAIPCRQSSNKRAKTDTYYYANAIKLRIKWEGEEFELV